MAEKKTAEIKIRCTPRFKEWAKQKAEKHGLNLSEIVEAGFRKFDEKYGKTKSQKVVHVADPELLRQLAKIGNNINQITKKVNQQKNDFSCTEVLILLNSIDKNLTDILEREIKDAK